MSNYARENKTQVLILLLVLTAGIVGGILISGGVSEEVEAQSGYTVDTDFTQHTRTAFKSVELGSGNVATASFDETVKVWDPSTGNVQTDFTQHTSFMRDVTELESGYVATASSDNTVKVWDPSTGNVQTDFTQHTDAVYSVIQLDNGNLASASFDETVKVWDPSTGNVQTNFTAHSEILLDLYELDNGNIVSISAILLGGSVKVWDPSTGNVQTDFTAHSGNIRDIHQLQSGNVLTVSDDETAKIWDPSTGNVQTDFTQHTDSVKGAVELSSGNIATGSFDNTVKVWDPSTGNVQTDFTQHTDALNDVIETTDGTIISISADNTAKIWDPSTGNVQTDFTAHSDSIPEVNQLSDGRVLTSDRSAVVKVWDAGLSAQTQKIADPVSVTDVQQASQDFTFYAVGNSDVSNTDTLTWEFGDGSTTTAQANKTVTHNYASHGRYTVNVITSDGNTRSTEVVVNSKPSISNNINPNPALEGESISLDGSGSDALTTAARPAPSQLQVTSGLRSWIPYDDTSSIDDSLYNGWTGKGVDLGNALNHDNPTSLYSIYSGSDGDESYITNPVDLQQDWTISTFVAAGSNSVAPVWLSSSGHGVYFDNGDLKRVYPSGSEVIGQVDPSAGGVDLTVTHDSSGSFTYYADGNLIGSDSYSSVVSDATYITQAPNQIDGQSQDTDIYLDNWRIYDRVLSQNEVGLIDDSYTVQTLSESKLYYDYQLDGTTISTNSTHTISGLQAGNYTVKLTVQDNDGLTTTSSKTLQVKDVVAPRIDQVSPTGDLSQRDIDIQADVSHPEIGSNYEVEVVLTRVNQQTGQTKTLLTKNITSNQLVSYNADHTNTGVENYNVNREYFEYEWTAQEPQQGLTESSGIKRYSIPVAEVIINNVNTEGLQSTRDVDLSADIDGTVTSSLDVKLELYDLREDETTTEYQTTISSAQTVSTTINHSLNRTAVPTDYRTQNRYSYQWVVTTDSGTTERSQTRDYLIPGLIYPVNENANLVGSVEDIINVADLTAEQDDYDISRSGKYNSSVFLPDFSRSYTALMYDTTDSAVFNKTFSADNEAFDFSGINLKDAYLVLNTEIGDNTYGVSAKRFQNGNVTLNVKDGVEYFVSVTDGETRRSVGPYIADKDNKDQSQTVSPDSLDFQETEQIQSQVSTTYDEQNQTGAITIEWSAGDKEVENLRVEVIRDDDDKIIFRDSVGGRVENYKNTVAISDVNSTYTTNFEYYLVNESKTVTSSEKVTIKFQQVLDGLPDWMTTALGVVILLMMTFILGEISAAYGLVAVVATGGVMTVIGWLPISITVVMQAGLVAILYFIQSDSTVT